MSDFARNGVEGTGPVTTFAIGERAY